MKLPLLIVGAAALAGGCVRFIEDAGPSGILETRVGSVLFDRIGGATSANVSFVVYNRTGDVVQLSQCPERLALEVEQRIDGVWTAVPELRCDGVQAEHQVGVADGVAFPGAIPMSDPGFYRFRAAVIAPAVEAPPSTMFEVR